MRENQGQVCTLASQKNWAFPVLYSKNRETPMRAEAVIKGDRLSDAKPLYYNETQPAGVAWVQWSAIQEVTAATIPGNRSARPRLDITVGDCVDKGSCARLPLQP